MRFLAVIVVIALTVYSLIDCVQAEPRQRRGLPAWLWLLIVIVLPVVGPVVWLISRNTVVQEQPAARRRPRSSMAPDDDPDFLAGLRGSSPFDPPAAGGAGRSGKAPEDAPSAKDEPASGTEGNPGTRAGGNRGAHGGKGAGGSQSSRPRAEGGKDKKTPRPDSPDPNHRGEEPHGN